MKAKIWSFADSSTSRRRPRPNHLLVPILDGVKLRSEKAVWKIDFDADAGTSSSAPFPESVVVGCAPKAR